MNAIKFAVGFDAAVSVGRWAVSQLRKNEPLTTPSSNDETIGIAKEDLTDEQLLQFFKDKRLTEKRIRDISLTREDFGVIRGETIEDVAQSFADIFQPITRETGIELGAAIRPSVGGGFFLSRVVIGDYKSVLPPLYADAAAYIHSHPSYSYAYESGFSLSDVKFKNNARVRVPFFMADKNGLRVCDSRVYCNVGLSPGVPVGN